MYNSVIHHILGKGFELGDNFLEWKESYWAEAERMQSRIGGYEAKR